MSDGFVLVDHQRSMAQLEATMRRVGAAMSCEAFLREVNVAYFEANARQYAVGMHQFLRQHGSHQHFQRALAEVGRLRAGPLRILDVGCGAGYELGILREVFPASAVELVVGLDISPEMLARARGQINGYPCRLLLGELPDALVDGPYDLVMTHALVHHIPTLARFFAGVDRAVAPGGFYLMGHEPNRRHWTNLETMPFFQELQRSQRRHKRLRQYLQPSRYLTKMARVLRLADDSSAEAEASRLLRERFHLVGDLTPREVQRIVNVHTPCRLPGDFRIGLDGFDWDELNAEMLRGFEIRSLATYPHFAHSCNPLDWPENWRELEAKLAEQYPLDGICFTALWQKQEPA
jgi:SAM-dependent methyltransferase